MITPTTSQIRVALFGEASAGKTALLASYYGTLQHPDDSRSFTLHAQQKAQGNRLIANYHQMEGGHFPPSTNDAEEYIFDLLVDGMTSSALSVSILDYPGGWWTQEAPDAEDEQNRQRVLQTLTLAQAGFLIVDGAAYKADGANYLKRLFDSFRQEVRRINRLPRPAEDTAPTLPPTWIIALSKSDLFETGFTAEAFSRRVLQDAQMQLQQLATALGSNELGNRFLLLSAARGEGDRVLDLDQKQGLALIAPLAFRASIEQHAAYAPAAGKMERFLTGLKQLVAFIDKADDALPKQAQFLTAIIRALSVNDFLTAKIETLQAERNKAVAQNDALRAAAISMAEQLRSDAATVAYYDNQPRPRP